MMRHLPIRRPAAVLFAVLVSVFALAGTVTAHAELEKPTPADGAIVPGTPPAIGATYSQAMDPDGSSLKLVDANGDEIATGGVLADDDTRMAIDPVPELAPGEYTVESTTKSADDGDIDRTTWTFTVTEAIVSSSPTPPPATATPSVVASAAPTAAPTPSPTAAPTPAPSPSGADTGSQTGSGTDVLLPILAAVVILVVIGGYLYSRRDRSTPSTPS
jgi:copper resistance protein C